MYDSLVNTLSAHFFSSTSRGKALTNTMTETPEQRAQNSKFGYKAPESVYQKHDPKSSLIGKGA